MDFIFLDIFMLFQLEQGDVMQVQSVTLLSLSHQLECKFNNDRNLTYICKYTPQCEGDFMVIVK